MSKVKYLKKVDDSTYFTTEEAAEALGIKPTAIRNYLSANKLTTYKFKTLTLISRNEINAWKDRQRKK